MTREEVENLLEAVSIVMQSEQREQFIADAYKIFVLYGINVPLLIAEEFKRNTEESLPKYTKEEWRTLMSADDYWEGKHFKLKNVNFKSMKDFLPIIAKGEENEKV